MLATRRKPYALSEAATVAVVAPAFAVEPERLACGEAQLASCGVRVVRREDLFDRCDYFAGDDRRRETELMDAIRDPDVEGVLCARGGYGCSRILPSLDAAAVRAAAKPLAGYSDITALLLWQWERAGLVGFHGPMLDREGGLSAPELTALVRMLRGQDEEVWLRGEGAREGVAEGFLIGGSLTLLAGSLGTPWEPQTAGSILLFEEVGEKPYAIDRMLAQLRAAGKLDGVVGVGVGHLVECTDPKRDRPTAREVIAAAFEPLAIPLVFDLPFGHASPNMPWPLGVSARIDGNSGELHILEPGVTPRESHTRHEEGTTASS
ncbi:MAG: LD-carboxypeptidase [Myxococcales bacterium]|nr:LD-carboxypeptidase [Myxococcales bacterium]